MYRKSDVSPLGNLAHVWALLFEFFGSDLPYLTVGPVVEAFGYSRIIFGSSPSPTSHSQSNAGDWYQIARDCFLELGVDQEAVDSVFGLNAKNVYGS